MPHFFINSNSVKNNEFIISDSSDYRHIVKSLRMKINENIKAIDEKGISYFGKISQINDETVIAEIIEQKKSERRLPFELYLAQTPLRSEAQNTVIEKATELGVKGVYPIYTDNCALKKSVIDSKISKWQNIMFAASKQCERADIPVCFPLSDIDEVVENQKFDKIFAFCERDTECSLKIFLEDNKIKTNEKILIIIGPEGGFSDNEFKYFKTHNIPRISLGDLILKAETAVIVAIGNIIYEYKK